MDLASYAPAERQKVGDDVRYVRLCDEPMPMSAVLPWLIERGFVKCAPVPDDVPGVFVVEDDGRRLVGWGTTYFAVPFEKSVARVAR